MELSALVFHRKFGRGRVKDISPSKSLVNVNFKHYGERRVLSGSLDNIK